MFISPDPVRQNEAILANQRGSFSLPPAASVDRTQALTPAQPAGWAVWRGRNTGAPGGHREASASAVAFRAPDADPRRTARAPFPDRDRVGLRVRGRPAHRRRTERKVRRLPV